MLTFESPFYEIEDVVVFRDHADPKTFHYLAGPPHLTWSDGKPNLLLLKYRHALEALGAAGAQTREQLGGGFLMFGVDCGLPQNTKDNITSKLAQYVDGDGGEISLVPVLYTKGTASVVALDKQSAVAAGPDEQTGEKSKFIRGILGSATPSLLQDERVIFSIALTPDGVTLVEGAYQSDLSPIGVMYELEFAGLRPALAVEATVDMKRVYQQLKAGLQIKYGSGTTTTTATTQAPASTTTTTAAPASTTTTTPAPASTTTTTTPAPSSSTTTTTTTTAAPATTTTTTTTAAPRTTTTTTPAASGTTTTPAPASTSTTTTTAAPNKTGVALSADLSLTMEWLKESRAIELRIIRQQEGQSVEQMEKNAMDLLKETILNQFFQPAMTNVSAAASAASAASAAQGLIANTADASKGRTGAGDQVEIGFQLQYKREEELKTATFNYNVAAPEKRTHAPNAFFSAILSNTQKENQIREVSLDDPFFKILDVDVSTTAEFEALDLKTLIVDLRYGGTPAAPAAIASPTFTPADSKAQHFQAYIDNNRHIYEYCARYKFGQAERIASQCSSYETGWRPAMTRALVVHPPDDIAMLRVYLEPGVVDWEIVDRIETRVLYEDPANQFTAERTFATVSGAARQEWIVRLTNPTLRKYKVQHKWFMKDHTSIQGELYEEDAAQLFVADPFADRLPIVIYPQVDPANISRINVELFYEDPERHFEVRKQLEIEGPQFRRANVSIPLMDGKRREYTHTIRLVKTNGKAENHEPKKTEDLSIVITEGGVYLDVDVVLIGEMAALKIDALQLDLKSEPPDGEAPKIESHLFLPGPEKRLAMRILLRADRPQVFQYRTCVVTAEKQIESDWQDHQSKILMVQLQRLLG